MPLTKAQFMEVPGGPGVVGAVKAGTGISVSGDGTISINPAQNVTKIVAGTNITLSPGSGVGEVTISSSGGGQGGVTNISVNSPITGGGSGSVSLGFDVNTVSLTKYLKLSGGTMEGPINMGNDSSHYISVPKGDLNQPSLRFVNDDRSGFACIAGGRTFSAILEGIERQRWDNGGNAIFANPRYAGADSPFRTGVQVWASQNDSVGASVASVYASNDRDAGAFYYGRRCRGNDPSSPQGVSTGDTYGGVTVSASRGGNWDSVNSGSIAGKTGLNDNVSAQWVFSTQKPNEGIYESFRVGPAGSLNPLNGQPDIGGASNKWNGIYIVNNPFIGAPYPDAPTSPLQPELGLDFINLLEPIAWVPDKIDSYTPPLVPPYTTDNNGIAPRTQTEIIVEPGDTTAWGITVDNLLDALQQTGLQGNFAVYNPGIPDPIDYPNSNESNPLIAYGELVLPLIVAVKQLSASNDDLQLQLGTLQTAFDNYVAAHP